jgi:hypothetical protein
VGTLVLRAAAPRPGGARLSVRWEGVDLGTHAVPSGAPRDLEYIVPPGVPVHGLNELWLWTDHPVGLVRLELLEPEPAPMERQLERNRRLRELQDQWRGPRDAGVPRP